MIISINPERSKWADLCRRPSSQNPKVREIVDGILERVKKDGDKALRELSLEIDKRQLDQIRVSKEEIEESGKQLSEALKQAIAQAAHNIGEFHKAQLPVAIEVETAPGVRCIQKPVAINNVGLYIPGGTAPLFSTVLMLAIPAKLAGCRNLVLCTPCGADGKISPAVLYAANFCGVDKIYKLGGASAIAAMAYGTESVDRVDKIFGPGNQFVTTAKQMVSTDSVAIDMPAGPSEVMVIADNAASPAAIAADLLSQAEHGKDSQVVLVCNDTALVKAVEEEILSQVKELKRCDLAESSLENSSLIAFDKIENIIDFANEYAPEHLIVNTENAWEITDKITCAGSVFVGRYTPESAGDYASGTNHTLPTCAWARSYSGVNIDSFMRKMTIQEISRKGLEQLGPVIVEMAQAEGLGAHANAVKVRIK